MSPSEASEELEGFVPEDDIRDRTTGLYCFIESDRVCNASCAAYVTHPRVSPASELNEQQSHCGLMLCFERMGRNVTVLAQIAAEGAKKKKIEEADKKREAQFSQSSSVAKTSPFPERKS